MTDSYEKIALRLMPRVLTLIDRNPKSQTYGCGDRAYHHYKTADFSSGMYPVVALPLAILYKHNFNGNIYYKKQKVKEWAIAAIRFAAESSHKNGSCDEFYPNEYSWGTSAISLADLTLAYRILGIKDQQLEDFFIKRARWIAQHGEPIVKTNHISSVALALLHTYKITNDNAFFIASERMILDIIKSQTSEGWFPEGNGCDFGYHTINFDFLSRWWVQNENTVLFHTLKRAAEFILPIVKKGRGFLPATGSRNCDQFCVTGFALMKDEIPEAREIEKIWLKYNCQPQCLDCRYVIQEPSLFLMAMLGKEVLK